MFFATARQGIKAKDIAAYCRDLSDHEFPDDDDDDEAPAPTLPSPSVSGPLTGKNKDKDKDNPIPADKGISDETELAVVENTVVLDKEVLNRCELAAVADAVSTQPRLIIPSILSAVSNRHIQFKTPILIDSGATDNVIGSDLVQKEGIPMVKKNIPVLARVIDGRELDPITHEAVLTVVIAGHASEETFDITKLGHQQVVLGHSYLKDHNPDVDWSAGKIKGWNTTCVKDYHVSFDDRAAAAGESDECRP
ncbi:hypothetical protein V1512DRAFT_255533, partial [Lipomyces arxii]|uniref:uncharacterized protein n=1 Tax=Lipomyces arxii TaxID=56418 RepID=UPI0034CD124D